MLRTLLLLLPLGVGAQVALSLATTDRHLLDAVAGYPRGPLAVAVALALVPWALNAARLRLWARFVGAPLRYRDALRVVLGGQLASSVTPTGTGGELLKWPLLVRLGVPTPTAGTLLVIEAVENALFMAVALPIVLVVMSVGGAPAIRGALGRAGADVVPFAVGLAVLIAVAGALWRAARAGWLGKRAGALLQRMGGRVRDGAARFRADLRRVAALVAERGKARLAAGLALTAAQWTARYSVVTAVLAFLGVPVRPVLFWGLQWVTFTLLNVVPTPGAAGGAEAAFAVLYSPFVPADLLGLATATWRLVLFYAPLAVAAGAFLWLGRRPDAPAERP